MSRRLAIVGSRDYPDPDGVRAFIRTLAPDTVIISGGARGVDRVAAAEAERCGLQTEVYPAQWERDGRSAGYQRNAVIVDRCDDVVAFWDGTSRGTAHTIRLARRRGKPVQVFSPPPDVRT